MNSSMRGLTSFQSQVRLSNSESLISKPSAAESSWNSGHSTTSRRRQEPSEYFKTLFSWVRHLSPFPKRNIINFYSLDKLNPVISAYSVTYFTIEMTETCSWFKFRNYSLVAFLILATVCNGLGSSGVSVGL